MDSKVAQMIKHRSNEKSMNNKTTTQMVPRSLVFGCRQQQQDQYQLLDLRQFSIDWMIELVIDRWIGQYTEIRIFRKVNSWIHRVSDRVLDS